LPFLPASFSCSSDGEAEAEDEDDVRADEEGAIEDGDDITEDDDDLAEGVDDDLAEDEDEDGDPWMRKPSVFVCRFVCCERGIAWRTGVVTLRQKTLFGRPPIPANCCHLPRACTYLSCRNKQEGGTSNFNHRGS